MNPSAANTQPAAPSASSSHPAPSPRNPVGAAATALGSIDVEHQPGVCNIGPAEIAVRRRAGHLATAATLGLLSALLASRAPRVARLLVAVPAAGAASGYLQARHRFCAGYGYRGLVNLGPLGGAKNVDDPEARELDRAAARRIGRTSALVGLAVGAAALAAPPWCGVTASRARAPRASRHSR